MMLEVMCSSTMFIRIVQISSLAIACIGQPLLTFCCHTEQKLFSRIVVALKITYIVLHLYYDKLERDCSLSVA